MLVVLAASVLALTFGNVLVRRLLMISACLMALLIGCSRTYLGLNWPSAVLAGWLLATTIVPVTMDLVNLALVPYPWVTQCPTCSIPTSSTMQRGN